MKRVVYYLILVISEVAVTAICLGSYAFITGLIGVSMKEIVWAPLVLVALGILNVMLAVNRTVGKRVLKIYCGLLSAGIIPLVFTLHYAFDYNNLPIIYFIILVFQVSFWELMSMFRIISLEK